jgi:5,10-methylenetetrahydrofolate reductase
MLTRHEGWARIAEVNPPDLPDLTHRHLEGSWEHVLITDNVFGKIRVSPYAYAARITHDVPSVHPTVVVSTRDRNILAIESEVRGALGNGVDSFLVVNGDTLPHVDHLAHHYEIAQHLRELQGHDEVPEFEVGMPTRFQKWQFRQRIDTGAQFLVAGPVVDPSTVEPSVAALGLRDNDPPVYLMVSPPFGLTWVQQIEDLGAVQASETFKRSLEAIEPSRRREHAWVEVAEMESRARDSGCAGVIVIGLKFGTVVGEAARELPGAHQAMSRP